MYSNDFTIASIDECFEEEGITKWELIKRCGANRVQSYRSFREGIHVPIHLTRLMEALGYDIEVRFVKRDR